MTLAFDFIARLSRPEATAVRRNANDSETTGDVRNYLPHVPAKMLDGGNASGEVRRIFGRRCPAFPRVFAACLPQSETESRPGNSIHTPVMAKGNNSHRKEVKKPKKEKPKAVPPKR